MVSWLGGSAQDGGIDSKIVIVMNLGFLSSQAFITFPILAIFSAILAAASCLFLGLNSGIDISITPKNS